MILAVLIQPKGVPSLRTLATGSDVMGLQSKNGTYSNVCGIRDQESGFHFNNLQRQSVSDKNEEQGCKQTGRRREGVAQPRVETFRLNPHRFIQHEPLCSQIHSYV